MPGIEQGLKVCVALEGATVVAAASQVVSLQAWLQGPSKGP